MTRPPPSAFITNRSKFPSRSPRLELNAIRVRSGENAGWLLLALSTRIGSKVSSTASRVCQIPSAPARLDARRSSPVTKMSALADAFHEVAAVMVALPMRTPVTSPPASTVATSGRSLLQVSRSAGPTERFSSSRSEADRVARPPGVRPTRARSMLRRLGTTVNAHEAGWKPATLAVRLDVPSARGLSSPAAGSYSASAVSATSHCTRTSGIGVPSADWAIAAILRLSPRGTSTGSVPGRGVRTTVCGTGCTMTSARSSCP